MSVFADFILPAAAGYGIGSVPFGLLIARVFKGIDPRSGGSGNVGATNVARLCGFKWGLLTLACDLLKGCLPVLCMVSAGDYGAAYRIGACVVLGHMFSCFLRFHGGKGVASTVGVFLALAPGALILAGAACILTIWKSGFVSAGSLVLVALLPVLLLFSGPPGSVPFALCIAALVVWAHRENIRRLRRGEEKPWLARRERP
ncbi:MAG: glycerol-3-phosphate 1-O-acyltransferase PlsY [Desulfovibrio sp.]|jgi:glycerol-3-phosphate acyltransferase PlsY|nr:glycerol-3-phosphate 1-O-acyltransferase PlsY [Desulfovibrio sp.]